MSTEPANPLFEGFKPQAIETPNQEPGGKPAKNPRKKREPKAPKVAREAAPKAPKKPRKPRAAKSPALPPALPPQYNLQTILKAMRELHEEDYVLFDKLLAAPEASRKRIMSALAKIFS